MAEKPELISAAFQGEVNAVKRLLAAQADVDGRNDNGATALMYATTAEVAQLLIDAGADTNAQDNNGTTVAMYATSYPKVLALLLDKGADPDVQNEPGDTALIWCGRFGRAAAAKALLAHGANAERKNKAGETIRSLAEEGGHANVIAVLDEAAAERQRALSEKTAMQHTTSATRQEHLKKGAPKIKFKGAG